MFGPDEVKKAVVDALNTDISIPSNQRGAMAVFVNTDKAQVVVATKIGDKWRAEIIAEHDWTGDNKVGAVIKGTW